MAAEDASAGAGPSQDHGSMPTTTIVKKTLTGLAKLWEDDKVVMKKGLKNGTLLQWPNTQTVGLTNGFEVLRLNSRVLCKVLEKWLPLAKDRQTVPVNLVKPEVGVGLKDFSIIFTN